MNTTYTTAKIHDSQGADILMTGDEGTEAYGDSAYISKNMLYFCQKKGFLFKITFFLFFGCILQRILKFI